MTHMDNIVSTAVALIGIRSGLTYTYDIETLLIFIIYYLIDIRKATPIFIFHHLLGISVSILGIYLNVYNYPTFQTRKMFLNIELTVPMFNLCLYTNNIFVHLLFFISFFYCRIYTQYYLLHDEKTHQEYHDVPKSFFGSHAVAHFRINDNEYNAGRHFAP